MAFEDWDEPPGTRSGNPFLWTTPHKSDSVTAQPPVDGREHQLWKTTGSWNNVDVYLFPSSGFWFSGLTAVTLRLYAMVSGGPVLVESVDLSTLVLDPATQSRIRALRARGRPTDGWMVTAQVVPGVDISKLPPAQVIAYMWGTETADTVTAEVVPGPEPIPVAITGQPIEVTGEGGDPVAVIDAPATNWTNQAGTAPDGSGGVTVATALAAGVAESYVAVSSAKSNAPGTIIYVKSAAGNLASASGYELSPGDTVEIPIDNANKIFILGSAAGLAYLAAVV